MSPLPRNSLFIISAFLIFPCLVFAQAPSSPPKPHQRPSLPIIDQEQFFAYWTTETGWTSELQLRNNATSQDLIVTPALRLADGAETALVPLTIRPQEVKSIDLAAAIPTSAAQLIGTYGSVVLRYRSPTAATLYAAMMVRRMGHAIAFHIDAIGESQDLQVGSREGIWWLPKETTSDYLILTNQGKNTLPLDLFLFDASGKQAKQEVLLAAGETTRYSIRKLILSAGLAGSYGGIKISTSAHAGSLDSLHFLFDEIAGFSAILKMFDYNPNAKLEERDYARTAAWTMRAPMLALSNPDAALAFPAGTKLLPQLFIRNTTAKPIDAALRFNWRTAAATGKAPGPTLHLFPYETRRVDVGALQDVAILPKEANWTSVTITTNSKPDEIVAVAASYDSALRYGAQTPFSDQLTFRWEGGMWEYDPYHNSIITAGNGGTKPTRAAFTIFYNQGTQRYDLEQALQADEQMWIDVGKLIREQVPDKNGKTLPPSLTSGSYEFRDLTNTGVGTLFEGKVIYDKTYGHVAYGCAACCGYGNPFPWYDPIGVSFSAPAEQGIDAPDQCQGGTLADVSDSFFYNWTSADTSIATVDSYGWHTGVSVASTMSQTNGPLNNNDVIRLCPQKRFYTQNGVNVNPKISFNGQNITGTTQSVVVGQQITLTASYGNITPTSQSWTVPGTVPANYVGGFNHTLTSGGYTQPTLNQQSTTLYWVTAANSQTVTFTLNYGSSQTATAQATFNIAGPTSPGAATQLGAVDIYPGPYLKFGDLATPGITFTASATPPAGYSNGFVWVQVNTNDALLITHYDNTTTSCTFTTTPPGGDPFLDTTYPYDTNNPTADSPQTILDSTTSKELIRNFSATMYLMWTPGLSNSIPVPLGSLGWQWSGDAVYNSGTQQWTVAGSSQSANAFQSSNTYPSWARYSNYSSRNCT